ncbi:DNA primase large subunit-like [Diorhabda carinulata]|uniref:DNA primase large subunit-like n=1 Tax=Diorhabda carinulata TaxID=1163345 RepID=UPI0025A05259|nr:DNA primase large subunit-like [Diorhabda carinulata]
MNFSAGRRKANNITLNPDIEKVFAHDLNMYKTNPSDTISLNEFEELALDRLQLLRTIEQASARGYKQFSEDWKSYIKEELAKLGLKRYLRLLLGYNGQTEQDTQARRTDHHSHFILRLAYCRSEDLRRWFLIRELEWFKLRFLVQNQQSIMKFLELNNLTYLPIPQDAKEKIKTKLLAATVGVHETNFNTIDFYKVPFTEVLSLIKNRRVFLEHGYAYIPTSELVVSIQAQFRASLNESLSTYNQRLPSVDDDRLNSLLCNLHNVYTGKTHVVEDSKDGINPANLDNYSQQHFPLCMRHLYNTLKSNHHLKHQGRLQLSLFLKGIGLLYEDGMKFWREEFTKNPNIDETKFDKAYSYTFRHSYGKAGGMTNYSPYSCIKIIMSSVGPGEHHGCPFKHWDPSILKNKLVEYGLAPQAISSIMDLVNGGHFQLACSKYFECVSRQPPTTTINHPNQYFSDKLGIFKEKQAKKN